MAENRYNMIPSWSEPATAFLSIGALGSVTLTGPEAVLSKSSLRLFINTGLTRILAGAAESAETSTSKKLRSRAGSSSTVAALFTQPKTVPMSHLPKPALSRTLLVRPD